MSKLTYDDLCVENISNVVKHHSFVSLQRRFPNGLDKPGVLRVTFAGLIFGDHKYLAPVETPDGKPIFSDSQLIQFDFPTESKHINIVDFEKISFNL